MCRAVKCRVCGKTTWSGCGMHVDAVRRSVPAGQWCNGHASSASGGTEPPRWTFFRRKSRTK